MSSEETPSSSVPGPALPVGDPTAALGSTRERVAKVMSATDQAAQSILEAAKAEAEAHVRETQRRVEQLARTRMEKLSTVTEDLLGQADRVRQEVDGLRQAIDGATAALAADLGLPSGEALASESPQTPAPGTGSWLDGVAPADPVQRGPAAAEPARTEAVRESGLPSEVIEIFVLKMLATGADRAAIERRLGEEFAVEDPAAVLERLGLTASQPGGQP